MFLPTHLVINLINSLRKIPNTLTKPQKIAALRDILVQHGIQIERLLVPEYRESVLSYFTGVRGGDELLGGGFLLGAGGGAAGECGARHPLLLFAVVPLERGTGDGRQGKLS